MMKRFYYILAASVLLFAGCQNEIDENAAVNPSVFTATIDGGEPATRTLLGAATTAGRDVLWKDGDELIVGGKTYRAGSLTDEGRTATLSPKVATELAQKNAADKYEAYYPTSIYNGGTPSLPAVQDYAAPTSADGNRVVASHLPMYVQSETTELNFKNLCAVLNFQLKGTDKVTKVVVTSATKALWGPFSVVSDAAVIDPSVTAAANRKVTLDCGTSGVPLNATTPTEFCIALPPATYGQNDLTVEVYGYKGTGTTEELLMPAFKNSAAAGSQLERSKIYDITVAPAPPQAGSLTLSDPVVMYLNGDNHTQTLTCTATDNIGSPVDNPTITWTSSVPGVATVSPTTGLITAVAAGTTTITASWEYGGQTETATKTVTVKDLDFSISPTSVTLWTTESQALTLTAKDGSADASGVTYSYSTDNTNVAAGSGANITAGNTAGQATVTVTASWHGITKSDNCVVTTQRLESVALNKTATTLAANGATETLTATVKYHNGTNSGQNLTVAANDLTWSSSNPSVAEVSASGVVTPKAAGTAYITASLTRGGVPVSATCEVTVIGLMGDVVSPNGTGWYGGSTGQTNGYVTVPISFDATGQAYLTRGWADGTITYVPDRTGNYGYYNVSNVPDDAYVVWSLPWWKELGVPGADLDWTSPQKAGIAVAITINSVVVNSFTEKNGTVHSINQTYSATSSVGYKAMALIEPQDDIDEGGGAVELICQNASGMPEGNGPILWSLNGTSFHLSFTLSPANLWKDCTADMTITFTHKGTQYTIEHAKASYYYRLSAWDGWTEYWYYNAR